MRKLIHLLIILLVLFSISVETYFFYHNDSIYINNFPVSKIGRLVYYYSYFTILSNITVAVSSFLLLLKPKINSQGFRILRLDGLICIIITSVVYNLILRNNHPPTGIMVFTNEFLHVIVPILVIVSWMFYDKHPQINPKVMIYAILPPLLYVIYIFIRGGITNLYPYPFMDAGIIGLPKALFNTSMVVVIFVFLEFILLSADKKLSRKNI